DVAGPILRRAPDGLRRGRLAGGRAWIDLTRGLHIALYLPRAGVEHEGVIVLGRGVDRRAVGVGRAPCLRRRRLCRRIAGRDLIERDADQLDRRDAAVAQIGVRLHQLGVVSRRRGVGHQLRVVLIERLLLFLVRALQRRLQRGRRVALRARGRRRRGGDLLDD